MKDMNNEEKIIVENVELCHTEKEKKEEFESMLEKIKTMSDAIELHTNVKKAVEKKDVDENYLKYIENSLEAKFFCDAKFNKLRSKVLLEVICPDLIHVQDFQIEKLVIEDIGYHFEEQDNYIDKICTYDNQFVSIFGINETNPEQVIKYQSRKFSRIDMIEAISEKIEAGKKMQMEQYDEYYVVSEENHLKVFSERKMISLMKVEETVFDKIKVGLSSLFQLNRFSKKKSMPNIQVVYDSNPNRFQTFEHISKVDAKSRMKVLLRKEREVTRSTNS